MIKIRQGIFETNSSSTHSIVIAKDSEWEDFFNHKKLYNLFSKKNYPGKTAPRFCNPLPQFVTVEELLHHIASLEDSLTDILFQLEHPSPVLDSRSREKLLKRRTNILDELAYMTETFIGCDDISKVVVCDSDGDGNACACCGEEVFPKGKSRIIKGYTAYGFDHFFG